MTTDLASAVAATTTVPPTFEAPPLPSPFTHTSPPPVLVTQGAEALLYKTHFLDTNTSAALKFRPSKAYRHPILDARLTKQRVLAEARVLVKLAGLKAEGVREVVVPGVLGLEWDVGRKVKGNIDGVVRLRRGQDVNGEQVQGNDGGAQGEKQEELVSAPAASGAWILMEWIEGRSVKELLRSMDLYMKHSAQNETDEGKSSLDEEVRKLLRKIGRTVGTMHSRGGVVHGDLTSSNIMVRPYSNATMNGPVAAVDGQAEEQELGTRCPTLSGEIVLIDFGLATQSIQDEDRAVDLYVLERAFGSTHPKQEGLFDGEVLQHQDGYRGSFKGANIVLKRLEEVRMRGRKRSMIG